MFRRFLLAVFVCFAVLTALCVVVLIIDRSETIVWIGAHDLSVEFTIADARTGQPIPNSGLNIINEDSEPREFNLRTDANGFAIRLLKDNLCTGRTSYLRFIDTRHFNPPGWRVQAHAEGFETGSWVHLHEYPTKSEYGGSKPDRLIVSLELHKAEQRGAANP